MTKYEPANPHEPLPAHPETSGTSTPSAAATSASPGTAPPPPGTSPDGSAPVTMAEQARRPRVPRLLSNRRRGWIAATALMCSVVGLSVYVATSPSASAGQPVASAAAPPAGGGGSNARSGPAAGGSSGTVSSVSKSSFTLTTSAAQKVVVNEASSTNYQKGTSATSASAVTKGERVLVLGTASGTTITATQVIVQTTGGSVTSSAAKVVPFKRGAPTTSKQVGQIPANWSQGSGTIVSGTAANKATEAALAAYPGGVVNRVVKLSNGEYNVHYIGVNWPHHIFVNQNFKVVGAL
jgi:hypothetical protein